MKRFSIMLLVVILFSTSILFCQNANENIPKPKNEFQSPLIYLVGGFGVNLGFAGSKNMSDLFKPYVYTPFSGFFNSNVKLGHLNLVQVEYRRYSDKITLNYNADLYGEDHYEIDMHRKVSAIIFKLNPFSLSNKIKNKDYGFFLTYGFGSTDKFTDKNGDGFKEGNTKIYGAEAFLVNNFKKYKYLCMMFALGFELETSYYERFEVEGYVPLTKGYTYWTLDFNLNVGIGFSI